MRQRFSICGAARGAVAVTIVACAVTATGRASAAGPDGYKIGPGPWKVAVGYALLRDERRQKDLGILVRYPVVSPGEPRKFPLIVFSHGAGGSDSAFPDLTAHWASHGYTVVLPTHSDSLKLRQVEDVASLKRELDSLIRNVKPLDRLAGVDFLLDRIGVLEQRVAALRDTRGAGRVDRDHVGMAGYSAGALTTQKAAGVKVRGAVPGAMLEARSVGDPRIDAAILISGQGTTDRMFTDQSWNELSRPMLVITGSKDVAAIGSETPASRREPFEKARPGDKYLVFIEGATHSSYQGKGRALALDPAQPTDEELKMIAGVTSAATLAFLDLHLKGDGGPEVDCGIMRVGCATRL